MFHCIQKKQVIVIISIIVVLLLIFGALAPLGSISEKTDRIQGQTAMKHYSKSMSTVRKNLISSTDTVDPTELYQNEPAPMGLADFGIENAGTSNQAYRYNTTSFLSSVNINSLSVVNNTTNNKCMTFQFNLNMAFYDGNSLYVYWVQDVAYVNTTSHDIAFLDNIWNLTSQSANMHNSTLSGNGTVGNSSGTHFYYSYANNSLPGNCLSLIYPSTIDFMVNSTVTSNGKPQVDFMYNDGYGWVTYDSPVFTFVNNLTVDLGFVVDGYTYEPDGYSFYDAELILGGPGDGSSTVDMKSNVSLSIQYWNGHNYQEIRSAYNFGTDTAETIANVVSSGCYYKSNGTIFESINPGPGQLGQVYNSSDISTLNISMPLASGTLYINGTPEKFVNDEINMTLAPGYYKMEVYNGTLLYKEFTIELTAGEYKSIKLDQTLITFTETGLPSGTEWDVNLTGHYYNSSNNYISLYEYNGNYSYTITTSNNLYIPIISSGILNATGNPITIPVTFKELTYNATFKEMGLNSGIWNIKIVEENSTVYNSGAITGQSYTFHLTNGTYHYSATSLDYKNISGEVYVNGRNTTVSISFVLQEYNITFISAGLPSGTTWYVNLTDNNSGPISGTSYIFTLTNGTYTFTIATSNHIYRAPISSGSFRINGKPISQNISFSKVTFNVTFKESGLKSGITWNIILNGKTYTLTHYLYTFQLTNGTYHYSATSLDYKNISGEVYVNGRNTTVPISFVLQEYNVTFIENGLPAGTSWVIILNSTEESSTSTTILFLEVNGTYSYTVNGISGYTVSPSGNVKVNGSNITEETTYTHNSMKKIPFNLPGSDIYMIGLVSLIIIALGAAIIVIRRKK